MLALADVGAAFVAATVASTVVSEPGWAFATAPFWVVFAKLLGLYDMDHKSVRHLTVDETSKIAGLAALGTVLLFLLVSWKPHRQAPTLPNLAAVYMAGFLAAFILRSAARSVWRRITPAERTAIVGNGQVAEMIRRKIELFPDMHLELVDIPVRHDEADAGDKPLDQRLGELLNKADRVILASDSPEPSVIANLAGSCRDHQVKLSVVSPFLGSALPAPRLSQIAELQMFEYQTWDVSRSTALLKRFLDLSVSVAALVFLAPLFVVIAVAIKLDSQGPVLFRQRRAGLRGGPFTMLKFRSMRVNAEEHLSELIKLDELSEPVFKLRDDPRVTRVGHLLRRTSLDELPQFFNVLRGQMSLVGPRPEELPVVDRYLPEHLFRLDLKPGITGPMQVCGRGELTFTERLAVERDYLENQSLTRDLRILAITVSIAFGGRGAY